MSSDLPSGTQSPFVHFRAGPQPPVGGHLHGHNSEESQSASTPAWSGRSGASSGCMHLRYGRRVSVDLDRKGAG